MKATLISKTRGFNSINAALLLLAGAIVVAGACSVEPDAPTVDAATLWMDTVERGDFVQTVRGAGVLEATPGGGWKAQVRVPETQSFDVKVGQAVLIDFRQGDVDGVVSALDSEFRQGTLTVEVEITDELPDGVRPGLSIDGQIEIQTVPSVLYVGRPAYGKANSEVQLFKVVENGEREAIRVPVQLGIASVNMIVVEAGLEEGDTIILSDMSRWDSVDRVRLH